MARLGVTERRQARSQSEPQERGTAVLQALSLSAEFLRRSMRNRWRLSQRLDARTSDEFSTPENRGAEGDTP
ncbi:MAG: hypothetical protein JNJ46_28105 [Myxococcales bacterium]|nr:hypothetical protein [Myxococcales bacterium]